MQNTSPTKQNESAQEPDISRSYTAGPSGTSIVESEASTRDELDGDVWSYLGAAQGTEAAGDPGIRAYQIGGAVCAAAAALATTLLQILLFGHGLEAISVVVAPALLGGVAMGAPLGRLCMGEHSGVGFATRVLALSLSGCVICGLLPSGLAVAWTDEQLRAVVLGGFSISLFSMAGMLVLSPAFIFTRSAVHNVAVFIEHGGRPARNYARR